MEEMKNEVMETENEVMDMDNYDETYENEGSGIGKFLVAGGVALGAVAIKKSKGKLDNWMKKRLEKKGYVVEDPEVERVEGEIVDSEESEETK